MSLNSSAVQPPITTQQQDTDLPAALVPGAAAAVNQSKSEHIEPVLLNPAKNNSSVQVVDELNRPSTPIVEHSAPEKSPRSTNAILAALPNTTDDSLENLKQAALSGDKEAQFNLGEMYDKGEGVEVDKVKAFEWYQKAAVQGYSKAQFNVGVMYVNGEGVEENKEKAFEWYQKAADQGHAAAQFTVAIMYRDGVGVEISKEKAFEWFHKAAVQGDLDAQFTVGMMYDEGEGVEQNEEKAFEWYQMAAGQGHPEAQFNLALMYDFGEGVEENEEKAFEWLSKAADQGHAKAQLSLSRCYGEGMGVGNDLLLATYWRIKSGLGSSTNGFSLDEDAELIKLIPSVMEKYSELKRIERIHLSTDSYFTQGHIAAIGIFIRSNYKVESLLIYSHASKLIDDQLIAFVDAVKFNTHLTSLKFVGVIISNEMNSQIEVLLTQNRDIAELRQYVKKHPLISTVDIPLELIKILDKKIIVSYLKSGQTKEAAKNAIDEFLMIASTTALAKDSKTS